MLRIAQHTRSIWLVAILATAATAMAQNTERAVFLSPDTIVILETGILFPWQSKKHRFGVYGPKVELALNTASTSSVQIDGLHKLANPGQWLFSLESASDLDGLLPAIADPRDIIRYDGESSFTTFFCGATTIDRVPATSNVDAIRLESNENAVVVSFDESTTIRGVTYGRNDLVSFTRPAGGDCNAWTVAGRVFDASGGRVPDTSNMVGASSSGGNPIFAFDEATDLLTTGGTTRFVRGQLVTWDGVFFQLFENLTGWKSTAKVNALALPYPTCQGLAGGDADDGLVTACSATWHNDAGELRTRIEWLAENDALSYNVYQGSLGNVASPSCLTPTSWTDLQFTTADTPAVGETLFYLVTAVFSSGEGSMGSGATGPRPNPNPCGAATD